MAAKKKTETVGSLKPGLPKTDGKVNWREIVSPENVLLNRFRLAEKGIDTAVLEEEKIKELKAIDENVTISLAGFREIAERKGYSSLSYVLEQRTHDLVVVKCKIKWAPSEDNPEGVENEGFGNSQTSNTSEKYFVFAEAIAENRAFTRTVRASINLPTFIVGDDELNQNDKPEIKAQSGPDPQAMFVSVMEASKLSFGDLQEIYEETGHKWNPDWVSVKSINTPVLLALVPLIKNYAKSAK